MNGRNITRVIIHTLIPFFGVIYILRGIYLYKNGYHLDDDLYFDRYSNGDLYIKEEAIFTLAFSAVIGLFVIIGCLQRWNL